MVPASKPAKVVPVVGNRKLKIIIRFGFINFLRNGRVWGKVCNEGCPPTQKTDNLDHYLSVFYYCNMSLKAVAEKCSVTPDAVEKALKRFDMQAYLVERNRRKEENKLKRQQNNRRRKYTPEAREKDRERKHTIEARQRDCERKHHEREVSTSYHLVARRVLKNQEVLHILRLALNSLKIKTAILLLKSLDSLEPYMILPMILPMIEVWQKLYGKIDDHTMCLRYIPCFKNIFHPVPQVTTPNVELITPKNVTRVVDYEVRTLRSDLVGVPGPGVLDITGHLDVGDIQSALTNAESAIIDAGYLAADATVEAVQKGWVRIIRPNELKNLRDACLNESIHMAKMPDKPNLPNMNREQSIRQIRCWESQNKAAERDAHWALGGRTGKKGKSGGTVNVDDRQKLSAVNGN